VTLTSGSRIGAYEILAAIGAGGMGEVYKARDSRLGRDVALKILPAHVAGDRSRRTRFEQEARAAAALNHPNIVSIYDVGAENDAVFIVTELVDGKTLRGAKPSLRTTLDYAVQIASGLAAAHAAGIVHRDLKPDNLLVTRDGRIKIVDFGLAKVAVEPALAGDAATVVAQTEPGVVLGTVGYMSPEQVKGLPADHRSDIFSFGVVLHELLSGAPAFHADTSAETMTAILKEDPPELPEFVTPGVRQIVTHCLEKDPVNRFQSARDLAFALGTLSHSGSQPRIVDAVVPAAPTWPRRALLAVAASALVAIGFAVARIARPVEVPAAWSGGILAGPEMALDPRVSPDGHLIAFEAFDRGLTQVAVMKPETGNWSMLTRERTNGTVNYLSWAPDGSSIYYQRSADAPRGIYRVPVLGGEERLILDAAGPCEALPDGSLLVVKPNDQRRPQLFHFWPETGKLDPLPIVIPGVFDATFTFRAVGDGRQVVVLGAPLGRESEGFQYRLVSLDTGASTAVPGTPSGNVGLAGGTVTRDGASLLLAVPAGSLTRIVSYPLRGKTAPRTLFTVTNHLWYLDVDREGTVFASVMDRPVEIVRRTIDGTQSERVASFPMQATPDIMAVLPDGRAVVPNLFAGRSRLVVAEAGKDPQPLAATNEQTSPPIALVGSRQIAVMIGDAPRRTIALIDIATGRIGGRIATDHGQVDSLAATPDGGTLFVSAGGTIWSVPVAGGALKFVRAGDYVAMDPAGRHLIVSAVENAQLRFYRVFLDGRPEQEIAIDRSLPIMDYAWSPNALSADGRLLVPLIAAWFNYPATLDTNTGRITRLPSDDVSDYHSMAWLPDGRIVALHTGLRASLWRFQREEP